MVRPATVGSLTAATGPRIARDSPEASKYSRLWKPLRPKRQEDGPRAELPATPGWLRAQSTVDPFIDGG